MYIYMYISAYLPSFRRPLQVPLVLQSKEPIENARRGAFLSPRAKYATESREPYKSLNIKKMQLAFNDIIAACSACKCSNTVKDSRVTSAHCIS